MPAPPSPASLTQLGGLLCLDASKGVFPLSHFQISELGPYVRTLALPQRRRAEPLQGTLLTSPRRGEGRGEGLASLRGQVLGSKGKPSPPLGSNVPLSFSSSPGCLRGKACLGPSKAGPDGRPLYGYSRPFCPSISNILTIGMGEPAPGLEEKHGSKKNDV